MKLSVFLIATAILPGALANWSCLSTCREDFDDLNDWDDWDDRRRHGKLMIRDDDDDDGRNGDDDWRGPGGRGPARFCRDDDFIEDLTECIGTSSCSDVDRSAIYDTVARACAHQNVTLNRGPYRTISVTSGAPFPTAGWSSIASGLISKVGPHFPGVTGMPGAGPGLGGEGRGPFDGGWGPFNREGSWTRGPWTSWWNGTACPAPSWSGWTEGNWRTNAEWTTWGACVATTTATEVVTVTRGNGVATSTSYGVRVAQAVNTNGGNGGSSGGGTVQQTAAPGAAAGRTHIAGGLVMAALGAAALL